MRNQLGKTALILGAFAMAAGSMPAQAQLGGLFGSKKKKDEPEAQEGCEKTTSNDVGSAMLGGLLGDAGRSVARDIGIPIYVPVSDFTDELATEIACRLDPKEQEQAANATIEATRGTGDDDLPDVGATASWTSESREDVSGSSTVTSREDAGEYDDCILVTDIIIVQGEETQAEKRMCRPEGSARYSIIA